MVGLHGRAKALGRKGLNTAPVLVFGGFCEGGI